MGRSRTCYICYQYILSKAVGLLVVRHLLLVEVMFVLYRRQITLAADMLMKPRQQFNQGMPNTQLVQRQK